LVKSLSDSGWQQRRVAANALGRIGVADESILAALRAAADDSNEAVRLSAKAALDQLAARNP
jgi:HEAT repeat protein